jgi:hypothetical protein
MTGQVRCRQQLSFGKSLKKRKVMSLLGKLVALFSGGTARSVCVVDGDRLAGGDRVGPGERFQVLSKLARFATRENMPVTVVFGGRPLREAADESNYNGVTVRYGETTEEVRLKLTKSLASSGRSKAALVTSDIEFESEMAAKGFSTMKVSTLRKAMDPPGSEGGSREGGGFGGNRERGERSDRGDRGGDREGGRRNRNRGRGGRRAPGEGGGNNTPADGSNRAAEGSASAPAGNDPVKNLIDLVE